MRFIDLITESLYANEEKLRHLINIALQGKSTIDDYLLDSKPAPKELIFINPVILQEIEDDELKDICRQAGFYCSIHYTNEGTPMMIEPIFVTPINQKNKLDLGKNQVYLHCSLCGTLDKSGIRCRSRKVDNEFDVYEDRIYLIPAALVSNYGDLVRMVSYEHQCSVRELSLYEITLPVGYEIYQDPTKNDAVYVTNNIPAKFIKKIPQ